MIRPSEMPILAHFDHFDPYNHWKILAKMLKNNFNQQYIHVGTLHHDILGRESKFKDYFHN